MQKEHCSADGCPLPILPEARPRRVLPLLFLLSLGVVYPGFLAVIFLKPEVFEHLFSSASGYFISGLGLSLLALCFILATLHFRRASRQYPLSEYPPPSHPSITEEMPDHLNQR